MKTIFVLVAMLHTTQPEMTQLADIATFETQAECMDNAKTNDAEMRKNIENMTVLDDATLELRCLAFAVKTPTPQ